VPTAAVSLYETLRADVLRGQARPDGLGAVVYYGMLEGLARLLRVSTAPTEPLPSTLALPGVRSDRAFLGLLANMILRVHSEVQHVY
jgi:hypothetical protein